MPLRLVDFKPWGESADHFSGSRGLSDHEEFSWQVPETDKATSGTHSPQENLF